MIAPVRQLRKMDLEWLGTHHCKKHGHSYLEHYQCYVAEKPDDSPFIERIGYFDIEASNLNADFGYMFSYCIVASDGQMEGRVLTPSEIRSGKFDEKLCTEMCSNLRDFHRIVVFYGGDHRFDLPFVRTRSIKHGCDFPLYKEIYCTDLWPICRNKLKLSSNRLANVCKFFGIEAKTHPMDYDIWCRAQSGDQKSLDYIWEHNVEDSKSLKEAYELLIPYARAGRTSI